MAQINILLGYTPPLLSVTVSVASRILVTFVGYRRVLLALFITFDTQSSLAALDAQQAPTAQSAGYRSIRLCVASSLLPYMNALVISGTVDPCFSAGY